MKVFNGNNMGRILAGLLLMLVMGCAASPDSLYNSQTVGMPSRNQKVGKGLQVGAVGSTDTFQANGYGVFDKSVAIGGGQLASAILNLTSTTKGFLPPRVTTAQMLAISSPANGLQVFNTDSQKFYYASSSSWYQFGAAGTTVTSGNATTLNGSALDLGGVSTKNTRIITDTFAITFITDTTLPNYSTVYHFGYTGSPYEVPFIIAHFRGQHYSALKMDENQYYQSIGSDSIGWSSVVQNQIAADGSGIFNGTYNYDQNTGFFYQNICYQQFGTGASDVEHSIYKAGNTLHASRDIGAVYLRYGNDGAAIHTMLTDTTADAPYGLYGWMNQNYVAYAPQSNEAGTAYPAKFSITVDGCVQRFDSGDYSYTIVPRQAPFDSCVIIYDAAGNPYLKDINSFVAATSLWDEGSLGSVSVLRDVRASNDPNSNNTTLIGIGAYAYGASDIVIGNGAGTTGDDGTNIIIGENAIGGSSAMFSVALGVGATVDGANAVALGGASASTGGVALGNGAAAGDYGVALGGGASAGTDQFAIAPSITSIKAALNPHSSGNTLISDGLGVATWGAYDYNNLSNLPTLFDGDYFSLTNYPTVWDWGSISSIPTSVTGYGITDAPMITSGATAPAFTPDKIGDLYIDTVAFKLYFAKGNASSADWIIAN